MSHVREHCNVPRTWFRRLGSVWCCTCGRMRVLTRHTGLGGSIKSWEPIKSQEQTDD
jgi:hypothetical protein